MSQRIDSSVAESEDSTPGTCSRSSTTAVTSLPIQSPSSSSRPSDTSIIAVAWGASSAPMASKGIGRR